MSKVRIRYAVYAGDNFMSDWATRDDAEKSLAALSYTKLPLEIVPIGDVSALAGIPDPAAFVKAARAMSFVVSCQSEDCTDESPCEACKRHSAFLASDRPGT